MSEPQQQHRRRPRSPYKCTFCDEHLRSLPDDRWQALFLIGSFQCPHCFAVYRRPLEWLGRKPWVNRFFSYGRNSGGGRSIVEKHQAEGYNGLDRRLSRFGRWLQQAEQRAYAKLMFPFHWLWAKVMDRFPRLRRRSGSHGSRRGDTAVSAMERRLRKQSWLNWLLGNRRR